MIELIKTKLGLCVGCNRCIRECPMEMANVTYQDEAGNIKVETDHTKCIGCGRCIAVCKHNAREYMDDTEHFFDDLSAGVPISLIVAPSIRTNIPEYKRLFTYLKHIGLKKIFDVSLGADICTWAHVRHIEQNGSSPLIAQPCPAIVLYCETYRHDLLDKLSPIHSPMACTAIYMNHYEGITDRIAALSPCIAKSAEFADTDLVQYNVTFDKLLQHLKKNNVELPWEETGFDHDASGLGTIFPMPGGLKENIEFHLGKTISVFKAEGFDVYNKLNTYAETPAEQLPGIFDVLSCAEGCNIGSAVSYKHNIFEIDAVMTENWHAVTDDGKRAYFESLYQMYDRNLDLPRFMRTYRMIESPCSLVTGKDIERAFELLGKTDYGKQHVDCGACGSETCHNMARKIALGVNIPVNCIVKTMEDAKREHEANLIAHGQNELQLTKLNLAAQATGISFWEMEAINDAPNHPEDYHFIWSDELRSILGFSDETDFPNRFSSWVDRIHPEDREEVLHRVRSCLLDKIGGVPFVIECRMFKKNGECGYFRTVSKGIRDKNGNIIRVTGTLMDITETKNILQETEQQKIAAEAANKAKTDFLSSMSHEIRTPMNAILGITEIQLRNETLAPEVRVALGKIHSAGDLLLGIINDVLDLSKIEVGKLEIMPSKYDVASLVNDITTLNMMRIGSKQIKFKLSVDENTPSTLCGDELRIKQILNNLLSNAIKYTEKGVVEFSVFVETTHGDDVILIFEVRDTGLGMTEEQVGQLFDKYTRFNMQVNRTIEGTGLGMSITQHLVRLMNGNIFVKSELEKGSVFTVHLPQEKIGSDVLGRELVKNLQNFSTNGIKQIKMAQVVFEPMPYGNVLVVDDVESNLYVATGLLAPYGLSVDTVISGFAAIDKIKEGRAYDIIFMDHMMPKMDGIETTKIIRDMGYKNPIVALTANVVSGQSGTFLANGFDDFVSKPIDVRQLNAVLKKFVRNKLASGVFKSVDQPKDGQTHVGTGIVRSSMSPQLINSFLRDACNAAVTLEAIHEKRNAYNVEDIRAYIISVHSLKSALANICELELSAFAGKLEQAGRVNDVAIISAETPLFLNKLSAVIEKITLQKKKDTDSRAVFGDYGYLREALRSVKEACEVFDKKFAKDTIAELRQKAWTRSINELLDAMVEHLLNGDFEEVSSTADRIVEMIPPQS